LLLMVVVPVVAVSGGYALKVSSARYAETDNAYVHAHMIAISADVDGRVIDVRVHENERVSAGQALFKLDPEPLQIAVDRAHADLDESRNHIEGLKSAYRQRQEDLKAAEANLDFTASELRRREKLLAGNVISQSDFDEARNRYRIADNQAASIRQDIARIQSELGGDPDIAPERHPRYRAAQAALAEAELNLRRTTVFAPEAGVIAKVDSLRPGDYLEAGQVVFTIVRDDSTWVEANLKETDLTYVRPGQKAAVSLDTYPGQKFTAVVDSIGMATGAEFSVLPPQNATGNWVKVVQRIPVRLRLTDAPKNAILRAGMSAEVEIDTGHQEDVLGLLKGALALEPASLPDQVVPAP
jgi:membrane fusion protein (multidrug efflux system)